MDTLILSCGTGGGHNAAGLAVKEEMLRRGHAAVMLDPYDLCDSDRISKRVDNTYITLAQRAPKAFGAVYAAGNLYRRLPWRSPVYFVNGRMADIMEAYFDAHPTDVVIMPHVFPAEILTYMRDHGKRVPKTIFVATDYTCIPFTEEAKCDAYITPSEQLTGEFIDRGIAKARLYPFGIPVSRAFQTVLTREQAKEMLGLDAAKRYLLVSGGSIGAGALAHTLEILCDLTRRTDFKLIVVCGSNERLYASLQQRYGDAVLLLRHTDQMALYLRASELYFTKPGGLSTTEAAVMGVPLALLPPIPGCEDRNREFFVRNGMAVVAEPSVQQLQKVLDLLDSAPDCARMLQCQRTVIRKDAAAKICDLAQRLVDGGEQP